MSANLWNLEHANFGAAAAAAAFHPLLDLNLTRAVPPGASGVLAAEAVPIAAPLPVENA